METRKALRAMLKRKEVILTPGAWDPISALLAESLGFKALYMGGSITGIHLGVTEPRLTMTEQVEAAARVVKAIKIPLIVDGNAGFGDALHTMRTIQEFEFARVAAVHIEDQIIPKRASYHKRLEHVVPLEEFLEKIQAALEARTDPDLVIIARTDAARAADEPSLKEAIRRMQACVEAGVDVVQPNPRSVEDLKIARREIPNVPLKVVGLISRKQAEEIGVQILINVRVGMNASVGAAMDAYQKFMETGEIEVTPRTTDIQKKIQELIHLPEYWKIEEATTEKRWQQQH